MANKILLGKAETRENVYIDIPTLVSTRLLVTASSGGGKSETLRRILEEAVAHIQCIVIDPEGEFSTLREQKPFVLVGEGGETSADIRTAGLVATRLLELNASAVCDVYEMRVHERHEWIKRFLDSLVHAPKSLWHPVLVVVDEAHTYCPEHGYGESVASQSVIDLANLGRKRGFCAILATQRLSKLSKNAAEPLQNYLVGRTTFDDQKRAASTFKIDPGAATRAFSLELERLKDGQFISRGRAITGDMLKVQVTRGATRAPKTGTAMAGVVTPTPAAIKALLPKLSDLPQEVERKARTEDDLRRDLTDAKRRIKELERAAPIVSTQDLKPDPEAIRQIVIGEVDSFFVTAQDKIGKRIAGELEKVIGRLQADIEFFAQFAAVLKDPQQWKARGLSSEGEKALKTVRMVEITPQSRQPGRAPAAYSRPVAQPPARRPTSPTQGDSGGSLTGPEQRILNAIAWLETIGVDTPEQPAVAFLAGYSYGGGGYNNPRGRLKTLGLVEYPSPGMVRAKDLLFPEGC